jgi:hypothetical protein
LAVAAAHAVIETMFPSQAESLHVFIADAMDIAFEPFFPGLVSATLLGPRTLQAHVDRVVSWWEARALSHRQALDTAGLHDTPESVPAIRIATRWLPATELCMPGARLEAREDGLFIITLPSPGHEVIRSALIRNLLGGFTALRGVFPVFYQGGGFITQPPAAGQARRRDDPDTRLCANTRPNQRMQDGGETIVIVEVERSNRSIKELMDTSALYCNATRARRSSSPRSYSA